MICIPTGCLPGLATVLTPIATAYLRWHDPRLARFSVIGDLAWKAYRRGQYEKAEALAQEGLELMQHYQPTDWNYGNVCHDTYQILGLLRLRAGDSAGACDCLRNAGKTPGSPRLDSYGPTLCLAHALAVQGHFDVVRDYLTDVGRFWGKSTLFPELARKQRRLLKQWKAELAEGRIPNHPDWHSDLSPLQRK